MEVTQFVSVVAHTTSTLNNSTTLNVIRKEILILEPVEIQAFVKAGYVNGWRVLNIKENKKEIIGDSYGSFSLISRLEK